MDLHAELLEIVEALAAANVDYALCGGMAVGFHGYPRFTKDIDFLVRPGDVEAFAEAVSGLGYRFRAGPIPFDSGTAKAREIFRISKVLGEETYTLDLLVVSSLLQEAWDDREVFAWEGRKVRVVSASGLATMKQLAGRAQDLVDLQNLGFTERTDDETEANQDG